MLLALQTEDLHQNISGQVVTGIYKAFLSALLWAVLVLPGRLVCAQDQKANSESTLEQAANLFEQGKLEEAADLLRPALRVNPKDPGTLGLMAIVLDAQKRFADAERYYTQALALAPQSAALRNNLGNHYLSSGATQRARAEFLKVVAVDPHHVNANLQLAQMCVAAKQGTAALRYLANLPASERAPEIQLLRAQAIYLDGRHSEAEDLVRRLDVQTANLAFSAGMVLAQWQRYDDAETMFTRALELSPSDFDTLYNLALAATRAAHLDRARQVYEIAIAQQPGNVDCIFALAGIYAQQAQPSLAASLLVEAQRLAPDRADVPKLMAQVAEQLGFYGDAANAYEQYLKLQPNDKVARREYNFALARSGHAITALPQLEAYARSHPTDALGIYELAYTEAFRNRAESFKLLDRAIALDPALLPARFTRAVFYAEDGRFAESIEDLEVIRTREPANPLVLDHLGDVYLQMGKYEAAEPILKRAVELAPDDPAPLMHYSKVLRRLGRQQEAVQVLEHFRKVAANHSQNTRRAGLFDYLRLPASAQRAQYVSGLEKASTANPRDLTLKLSLARAFLEQGNPGKAIDALRDLTAVTRDNQVLAEAGKVLVEAGQYEAAKQFLQASLAANPAGGEARLDLSTAMFHTGAPEAALAELDKTTPAGRTGDYYLLRAELLDAVGRTEEAADSLNRGLRSAPSRTDLYLQSAFFLIKHDRQRDAAQLLDQASQIVRDDPELLLARAITLELMQHTNEAKKVLARIQSRWPEWNRSYLLNGIILENELKSAEAKDMLESAIALGASDPEAYYYLASALTHISPPDFEAAADAISQAVTRDPTDAYSRLLAGKIALERRQNDQAIGQLREAVRLNPGMMATHYALRNAYRAIGDEKASAAELEAIQKIAKENPQPDLAPSPLRKLLFMVRPPA